MVYRVRHQDTLTDSFYNVEQPVTELEDTEATELAVDHFADAIMQQCRDAFRKGWNGWNREDLCAVPHLIEKMKKAFSEGDVVKVGVYLTMIYGRGVENFEESKRQARLADIGLEIERLLAAEETILSVCDDVGTSGVIADIHAKMHNLDRERLLLLKHLA